MSHLNDLIRQLATKDEALARDIEREVTALQDRRAFGLNFERHQPEAVELPGRKARRGDKVRVLPPRGQMPKKENERLFRVREFAATDDGRAATIEALDDAEVTGEAALEDLVVVAEFRDPIYPGLVSTGKVERGGDKPYHSVINAENYHALQALLFTHRGKVDCIYIDPPYNTGAKDWKYNNDYVEGDDLYRHSKWLAFMERRLLLAKELLNPDDSVLIVTIDEKEYLRLGMLLEQTFPSAAMQMLTVATNKKGSSRPGRFSRSDEYVFILYFGQAVASPGMDNMLTEQQSDAVDKRAIWNSLLRRGDDAARVNRPNMFYPVWTDDTGRIVEVGDGLPLTTSRHTVEGPANAKPSWPLRSDGSEGRWQVGPDRLRQLLAAGHAKAGAWNEKSQQHSVLFLKSGQIKEIEQGHIEVSGTAADGSLVLTRVSGRDDVGKAPRTMWVRDRHDASIYGSTLLRSVIPGRKFPFPKSLYAVEDTLRFFVADKPRATVVDFFSGSGTTAHAILRLNKQDGGERVSISVTNNEVAADEQVALRRDRGLRPGDPEWESRGICEYITKPRIAAAVTGKSSDGKALRGDYKFVDEFPMADGFEENVEFFTLTYESPIRVEANRDFSRIAPLLWLRAGSTGRRIERLPEGWDVAENYGVISDLDHSEQFVRAIVATPKASVAFIITDEDRLFEALVRELPEHVEPVRLYEAYLRTFEIEARRAAER